MNQALATEPPTSLDILWTFGNWRTLWIYKWTFSMDLFPAFLPVSYFTGDPPYLHLLNFHWMPTKLVSQELRQEPRVGFQKRCTKVTPSPTPMKTLVDPLHGLPFTYPLEGLRHLSGYGLFCYIWILQRS